jgi:hypothetical protein
LGLGAGTLDTALSLDINGVVLAVTRVTTTSAPGNVGSNSSNDDTISDAEIALIFVALLLVLLIILVALTISWSGEPQPEEQPDTAPVDEASVHPKWWDAESAVYGTRSQGATNAAANPDSTTPHGANTPRWSDSVNSGTTEWVVWAPNTTQTQGLQHDGHAPTAQVYGMARSEDGKSTVDTVQTVDKCDTGMQTMTFSDAEGTQQPGQSDLGKHQLSTQNGPPSRRKGVSFGVEAEEASLPPSPTTPTHMRGPEVEEETSELLAKTLFRRQRLLSESAVTGQRSDYSDAEFEGVIPRVDVEQAAIDLRRKRQWQSMRLNPPQKWERLQEHQPQSFKETSSAGSGNGGHPTDDVNNDGNTARENDTDSSHIYPASSSGSAHLRALGSDEKDEPVDDDLEDPTREFH